MAPVRLRSRHGDLAAPHSPFQHILESQNNKRRFVRHLLALPDSNGPERHNPPWWRIVPRGGSTRSRSSGWDRELHRRSDHERRQVATVSSVVWGGRAATYPYSRDAAGPKSLVRILQTLWLLRRSIPGCGHWGYWRDRRGGKPSLA